MEFKGFFKAAMRGDTPEILNLLDRLQTQEQKAWYAGAALTYAAWKGHVQTVIALCDWGVDVDFTNRAGQTAMMYAARWGDGEIVRVLVQRGANAQIQDASGKTAVDYSHLNKHKNEIIPLFSK